MARNIARGTERTLRLLEAVMGEQPRGWSPAVSVFLHPEEYESAIHAAIADPERRKIQLRYVRFKQLTQTLYRAGSSRRASISTGLGGFRPPSYQHSFTGGRSPRAGKR